MLLNRLTSAGSRAFAGRGRVRSFAAAHGPTGYGEGPYRGIEPQLPGFWHTATARGMGCIMWLWIFYRAKVDGKAFLVSAARAAPARRASAPARRRSRAHVQPAPPLRPLRAMSAVHRGPLGARRSGRAAHRAAQVGQGPRVHPGRGEARGGDQSGRQPPPSRRRRGRGCGGGALSSPQ
jgi:hypothetical protein